MKRIIYTLFLSISTILVFSQQVPRNMVVVEVGTGTWCQYCPGAAMGVDDLIANGCNVAAVEYHSGDSFTNTASSARVSYYNITGFPTAYFDGTLNYMGGSSSQSLYSTYLPLYQQRIAIPSSYTIEVFGDNTGLNYNLTMVLNKVAASSATNIKTHLVLTESEIVYSWQGQTELNYVERLMAPDHNGTSVDFTSNSEIILPLSFTLDASWVTAHCELVAFLQDNNTKEILQGFKVPLNDLMPYAPQATFSSSTSLPCVTSSVDFFGNNASNIISWDWTFEGGNPAASSQANPTVTYNTLGSYDVQLIVSDGVIFDTLNSTEYINVITNPDQPDTPMGEVDVCAGSQDVEYSTNGVPWATSYSWSVSPANAGTITGNGTTALLDQNPAFIGDFSVSVVASNGCGTSAPSVSLQASAWEIPAEHTLSDGAGYCEGEPGIEVILDGSDVGVDYELYLDGDPTGIILTGTGSALSFGYQQGPGIYTCNGYTAYCDYQMIGNAYIHMMDLPGTAGTPAGSTMECNYNAGVEYTTSGASNAGYYEWTLTPEEAGTINGSTQLAVVDWDPSYEGFAYISVTGVNICGEGAMSQELEVSVNPAPLPVVSGLDLVCNNDAGILYSTPETGGNSYYWEVIGGSIAGGQGTAEVMVNWGNPGTGSVTVSEITAAGCQEVSETFPVTIDDCTGIIESENESLAIYPNPVEDHLTVKCEVPKTGELLISIHNQFGQVISSSRAKAEQGIFQADFSTASFPAGVYSVRLSMNGQTFLEGKFIRVK